jgi:hypothetical protein
VSFDDCRIGQQRPMLPLPAFAFKRSFLAKNRSTFFTWASMKVAKFQQPSHIAI